MTKNVLVAGGGVGGLEAVLALRALAPGSVRVRMLSPDTHFAYRPLSVAEPFGRARPVRVDLAALAAERDVELVHGAVARIEDRWVVTTEDDAFDYDALILAVGARPAVAVPGSLTFRGPRDVDRVRAALERLADEERPQI